MSQTAIERTSKTSPLILIPDREQDLSIQERQRRAIEQAGLETSRAAAKRRLRRRLRIYCLLALLLAVSAVAGKRYLIWSAVHETTDDASVDGHIIQVGPRVAGTIARVCVKDNQPVQKGDLLAELDPKDFQVNVTQAQAALDVALAKQRAANINVDMTRVTSVASVTQAAAGVEVCKAQVEAARGNLASAQADVTGAEAEYSSTRSTLDRYARLDRRTISPKELDTVNATARVAEAQLRAAKKRVLAAESEVTEAEARVLQAQGALDAANVAPQQIAQSKTQADNAAAEVEQARAKLQQAKMDLEYTRVLAPAAGRVTRKSAETGAYVNVGQSLMVLVPAELWVVANFKETQIRQMCPGQPVEMRIDACPGRIFFGHIDSIQSGTGSAFTSPQQANATGDYVKVVQRVPVKILFDELLDPTHPLSPGMSVNATVQTGSTSPLKAFFWK